MASIRDQLLLVNSDMYKSGCRSLDEVETPDTIANLNEIPFQVRGFPENPQEKFLLIEISRHIEAMAWQAGEGRLATGFQHLSRLEEEPGARRVYDELQSETDVDIHVYGVPDTDVTVPGLTVHGSDTGELRHTWFVVYQSGHHPHEAAALISEETDSNTWEGFWTYDPDRVKENLNYLDEKYS